MKSLFAISFLAFGVLAFPAFTSAQTAAPTKVAIIDSAMFADEKTGITKFVTAMKSVESQFTATRTELSGMNTRLTNLTKEVETLRNSPAVNQASLQKKIQEAQDLDRDIRRKTEDAQGLYSVKQRDATQPIQQAMYVAMQEFAKTRGYAVIFDVAKDEKGLLLVIGDQSVNVTRDFITFFNARP